MGSPSPKDGCELTLASLHVRAISSRSRRGVVIAGNLVLPCLLGRSGAKFRKVEGDGATPRGTWHLRRIFVREPVRHYLGPLPRCRIAPEDGWCDDPADRSYNRAVRLPYPASHERLWRDDRLYDLLVVLDWNMAPVIRQRGSAIFLHLARDGYAPTEGCIALSRHDMGRLLPELDRGTEIIVR